MHRDKFGRWRAGKSPYTPKLSRLDHKRDGGILDQLIGRVPSKDGTFVAEDAASDANSMTPRSALLSARSTSTIMSASTALSDSDSMAERAAATSAQKYRNKKTKRHWVSAFSMISWSDSPMFLFLDMQQRSCQKNTHASIFLHIEHTHILTCR